MTPEDYTTIVRDGDIARAMYDLEKAPICADIQGEIVAFAAGDIVFIESTVVPWVVLKIQSMFAQHDVVFVKDATDIFDAVNYGELTPEEGAAQLFAQCVNGEE